ncbi:tetratricopeptide repeat protein [Planctomycetota bacterium]
MFLKNESLFIYIVLALVTAAVYAPAVKHEFIRYDDDTYVTTNRNLQQDFSFKTVKWALGTGHASNWHPVTWFSHILDYQLFGLEPAGHHLVNLALHIINTLLLFGVLKQMTGAVWPCAFVAALFALHPLHVESVAWVAERKDLLSTFFWLSTTIAYVRYTKKSRVACYILVLILFGLGLMAKPMLVTLPFVLLLLDYWPLERFGKKNTLRLIVEKIPLIAITIGSSVITFIVQRAGGAMANMQKYDMQTRLGNAAVSYVTYIVKMFYPTRLAVLYPHPGNSLSMTKVLLCVVVLVLLTFVFLYLARRKKYFAVGWLWYLGTLVPVIGIVQVGVQSHSDRYTYITLTGLFIIIAFAVLEFTMKLPYRKTILSLAVVLILGSCAFGTSVQLRHWKNSMTLFSHTLDITSNNFIMLNNYANLLGDVGQNELAIEHFNKALKLRPNDVEIHTNLANALAKVGKTEDAVKHFERALKLKPNFGEGHYNFALLLSRTGQTEAAIRHYRRAIELDRYNVDALNNLAWILYQQGQFERAAEYFGKAIEVKPDSVVAHGRLGLTLNQLGRIDETIEQFKIVLQAIPDDAEMHFNLAYLLNSKGQTDQAIIHCKKALQINPNMEKAQKLLNSAIKK